MKKTNIKRTISYIIASFILFSSFFTCYAKENEESNRIVRVGWYETEQDDSELTSNSHEYDYEYLQALSQYTGWTYEYVDGTWEECLEMLKDGKIDMLSFVQKSEEREKIYGFPNLPMAITNGYLVTGSANSTLDATAETLDGICVGIVNGNAYNEDFEKYRQDNHFDVTYINYDSVADIAPALERGEIQAAVVAQEDKTAAENIVFSFAVYDQYFATNINDTEFLSELNIAMKQVNTYCPYLNNDLYQKYFSVNSNGKPQFTSAELEFINENPNILVLYDAGWPPVECWDSQSGTYKGISPDLFALLSQKCDINFVYEGSTSGDVLTSLQNGDQRNVLTTISYDYAWADSHDVYITQPFISSTIVKLGKHLNTENPTVAINEKAYFTFLLSKELEGVNTLNFAKQAERLEAVRKGDADYTFVTEDQANYYRSIPKYSNLETEKLIGYEQKICISIKRNSDPELMSIISKSLASITHDEMTNIIRNNTTNTYQITFGDYLYKNKVPLIVITLLAIVIITALIIISTIRHKSTKIIKKAYLQKEEALVVAQQASAAKGNFMSRMSHEIRTPLNAVIGYNMIARNELSDAKTEAERRCAEMKVMDCLTKSDIASKHLLTIINDVLDMSAIESGKIKIEHERFDFKGLITSLTTIFYSQAKSKGVELEVLFDTITEEWFIGDQMRTNQILTNLLSNAIKFTSEGGHVKLSICQQESTNNSFHIQFEITDSGIGMTDEYLSHIWTPFEQADSSISRRFGGTGLGLSITKNLVDLMHGEIKVESKPGCGTTFTVNLTFQKADPPEHSDSYDFSGINALIVDDDTSTCDYIRLLFHRCGARCVTATSGMDALEALAISIANKDRFTLCLVDWRMPKMDGVETIKRIRDIAGENIPIIVLTAYDYTELADKAAELGVNRFISKPLFQSSLFDLLANVCGVSSPRKLVKNPTYDFSGAKVLLAEDNIMNMEIAKKLMESVGLLVDSAWNGSEAVTMFNKSTPGTYMAILMDVHMPVMNGYEATKEIRAIVREDAASIPIIAMTADAFAEDVAEALASGMNDHVAKPIDVSMLFEKLSHYYK